MLGQKILILLIGSTVVTSHVINYKTRTQEHVPPTSETAELMPFITHFLPPASNFFYKPQFYISSPITKIIEKDCEQIEVSHEFRPEMPAIVMPEVNILSDDTMDCVPELRPVNIPAAPILPPLDIPKLPEPEVIDIPVPAMPEFDMPEHQLLTIPEAPMLPPFTMPELPKPVIECDHIPEVPMFPTFIPEQPASLEIPQAPILPHFIKPELPQVEIIPEYKPIEIPTAPELPPFTMPDIPPLVDVITDCHDLGPINIPDAHVSVDIIAEHKPIEIPQAPELPPFIMPELPTPVVVETIPEDKPCNLPEVPILPPFSKHEFPQVEIIHEHKPIDIPNAPELPPFTMPELHTVVVETIPEIPEFKPWNVPEGPKIPECEHIETIVPTVPIPEAPVLPHFTIEPVPEFVPEHHIIEPHPNWSAVIPEAPSVPQSPLIDGVTSHFGASFPDYCAHTIVLDSEGKQPAYRSDYPVWPYPAPTSFYNTVY